MQIALIEKANTSNITIVGDGNYRLSLPDGSQVSPVYAGWENEIWMLREIDFDSVLPTYLVTVTTGANTGSGYTANDILTISGGTSSGNVAQVQVYSIGSNGIVTGIIIANSGYYTSNPEANNSPTGGTGSGLIVNLMMEQYPINSKSYVYDANTNMAVETNTYGTPVIDNSISIEMQRQASLNADSNNTNLKDKITTATAAQIDNWLQNNVTDLASARVVLGAVIKFLANTYKQVQSLQERLN